MSFRLSAVQGAPAMPQLRHLYVYICGDIMYSRIDIKEVGYGPDRYRSR